MKYSLQRVRLNSQGYDPAGGYWGLNHPLWYIVSDATRGEYLRAPNREAAKNKFRAEYDRKATFYR